MQGSEIYCFNCFNSNSGKNLLAAIVILGMLVSIASTAIAVKTVIPKQ